MIDIFLKTKVDPELPSFRDRSGPYIFYADLDRNGTVSHSLWAVSTEIFLRVMPWQLSSLIREENE